MRTEWRTQTRGSMQGIPRCTKAVFRGEGKRGLDYSHTLVITEMSRPTLYSKRWGWHDLHPAPDPRRVVPLGILGGGWCAVLRILTLLQIKKCYFPHPLSDQLCKIHTHFWTWPNLARSRLTDSWGGSPVFSRYIFMFLLSQFSGPNYLRAWNRLHEV